MKQKRCYTHVGHGPTEVVYKEVVLALNDKK